MSNNTKNTNSNESLVIRCKTSVVPKASMDNEIAGATYYGWQLVSSSDLGPEEGYPEDSVLLIFRVDLEKMAKYIAITH
jgi:hypothetical protein